MLDPFAGGGAIPLEAMRLGCEVTAMDINPVAWFILKCTLEYPQRLSGQTQPLPDFAVADREFIEAFLKAKGFTGARLRAELERLGHGSGAVQLNAFPHARFEQPTFFPKVDADLAWHVRAWGRWVLSRARRELSAHYPTYADFQSLAQGLDFQPQPMRLLDIDDEGVPQLDPLNADFEAAYLRDPRNPRWVAKPTVSYLWARTVLCKRCRANLPLLKTRWLCKKDDKRVLLTMEPEAKGGGMVFGVQAEVPRNGGNSAQRREHDKRIGNGTMSRTGAACPRCEYIMTMEDIRYEGRAGRLSAVMTAVVVDGPKGKEYRLPTTRELEAANVTEEQIQALYSDIPFGLPEEPLPSKEALGFRVPLYGFDTWRKLFTNRQLLALGEFVRALRAVPDQLGSYPTDWAESLTAMCLPIISRMADRGSTLASWTNDRETTRSTFARFALPIVWDFAEYAPLSDTTGGFVQSIDWVAKVCDHLQMSVESSRRGESLLGSAIACSVDDVDLIVTDPPYYDAIPYSDLMDFFYVWLRRSIPELPQTFGRVFSNPLGPKWNPDTGDGELIDDASRFGGDKDRSKQNYEEGMARSFRSCHAALKNDGRLVLVFANKHPDAWETLVAALIRSGFVVDGSWPIQTEMGNRNRAISSAALSSSVWLVCRKRTAARPGWDAAVLDEMRENVTQKLRDFWDAGIRGPDFVWAATGPALEAFSKYPVVKKANDPDHLMTVSEFLREVRRMVVDFVVGRVLTAVGDQDTVSGLDDVTTYYLLHRNDFGMDDAPVGACILYALSCNLSDSALVGPHDLLAQSGGGQSDGEDAEDDAPGGEEPDEAGGSGARLRLKAWSRRHGSNLGLEGPGGRPAPLIDQVHRLMRLWRAGDQARVDGYLDTQGLPHNTLFGQVLQALIELAGEGSEERAILEAISNHSTSRDGVRAPGQPSLPFGGVL